MAIPIIHFWQKYFQNHDEGLGSTYERFIINEVLFKTVAHYRIKSVIETPSLGFTGLSGINSMGLALNDVDVTITDSDIKRLKLIKEIWSKINIDLSLQNNVHNKIAAHFDLVQDYSRLAYKDDSFDMAWNFSALWFVPDLDRFLKELSRISKKIILIMVPNRTGLGYLHQKYTGQNDLKKYLKAENIIPKNFVKPLESLGWKLMHDSLIDCPLWPDIGMSKEDFLKMIFAPFYQKKEKCEATTHTARHPLSIVHYYDGKDPSLKNNVLKYDFFERYAPYFFKKIWAHHHYYLFLNAHVISRSEK